MAAHSGRSPTATPGSTLGRCREGICFAFTPTFPAERVMISDRERAEIAFQAALASTRRGALEARLRNLPDDQKAEASHAFRKEPLLLSPDLEALAHEILQDARGPRITKVTPLPLTLWRGGRTDVDSGEAIASSLADFAEILRTRTNSVCEKGRGWVIEPTSTTDGRRTNASTTAIHALFLDCDGGGTWDRLLDALRDLGYAHLAYQSGGGSEEAPKWRLLLPLATPFRTSSETERTAWRTLYAACRVLLGALGHLLGPGFDPATDVPAAPWFLTERRRSSDPPRQIVLHVPGTSLDLLHLALALPEISEPERPNRAPSFSSGVVTKTALPSFPPDQLDRVVAALANVTTSVPSGRRTLYLALSGALLDREVAPEDVLQIVEDVSASYPRPNEENHRDNLHSARTTVGKWERGEDFTRIGTLQEAFPEVARALDQVLPDPLDEALRRSMEAMVEGDGKESEIALPAENASIPKRIAALLRRLRQIAKTKEEHKNPQQQLGGKLLRHLLDPAFQPETLSETSRNTLYQKAFALVGFEEPEIAFDALAEALREGLRREPSAKDYAVGTAALLEGKARRAKWDAEAPAREARAQAEAEASRERLRIFYATGKIP